MYTITFYLDNAEEVKAMLKTVVAKNAVIHSKFAPDELLDILDNKAVTECSPGMSEFKDIPAYTGD